ncbi:TrkH-domain-containing protein [Thozetella sp. PMI_491]|nr:TrkH-domain-containing protein [Thozetella sp. PMI_491]
MSDSRHQQDKYSQLDHVFTILARLLPPLNFITIHYVYFIVVCLVSSAIFWGSSNPARSISYTDSLFLVVSAMTEAGLNTVNLSEMTTWQQILLFLLITFGGSIWVSIWTVLARKHAFEQRFRDIVRAERLRRLSRSNTSLSGKSPLRRLVSFRRLSTSESLASETLQREATAPSQERDNPAGRPTIPPAGNQSTATVTGTLAQAGDGSVSLPPSAMSRIVFADLPLPPVGSNVATASGSARHRTGVMHRNVAASGGVFSNEKKPLAVHQFLTNRTVGRNSQFHDLTSEEREQLGGYEYRALKVLAVLVPLYFCLWHLLGCIALGAWISKNLPDVPLQNGINPWWLGIFNGASAFNNSGMSLLDANMMPFQTSPFVLITMGLLILAGNTAYPIFLRFIIWSLLKVLTLRTTDDFSDLKETLRFILKYPRRVYTNLFPSRPTWWLFFMLIWLNSVDWIAFELLNFGNPVVESIPTNYRVLDGLFQALAVRSGGFYVVNISKVYIGLQVLYVIMMYISVYPVVITMRHSNVYEERSLGIYGNDDPAPYDPESTSRDSRHPSAAANAIEKAFSRIVNWQGVGATSSAPESHISFISQQVQGQLVHDIWWLVMATLVISTIETSNWLRDPAEFSVFNIIFEVVSAYGCVGISVGISGASYSFSGGWHTASKLVLCLVMIRGRHRGLPVALDRAVRFPGEEMHDDEEEDHRIRQSITVPRISQDD